MKHQTAVCLLFVASLATPNFAEAEPAQVEESRQEVEESEEGIAGTTKEYLQAYRSKVDANTKITEFLSSHRRILRVEAV